MINMLFTLALLQPPDQPVEIVPGGTPAPESPTATEGPAALASSDNQKAAVSAEVRAEANEDYPALPVNPINSSLIAPGPTPELTVPTLDVWSLALKLDPDGTYVKATLAPFAFFRSGTYVPVLSNLRISAFSDPSKGKFGASVTLGANTMSKRYRQKKDDAQASTPRCIAATSSDHEEKLKKLSEELKKLDSSEASEKANSAADELLNAIKKLPREKDEILTLGELEELEDFASNLETLKEQIGYLANSLPEDDKNRQALKNANIALNDVGVDCVAKDLVERWMVEDYTHGVGFYVTGSVSGFAYVVGPRIQDDPTCEGTQTPDADACVVAGGETYSAVAPERLASASVAATFTYFPSLRFGLWVTGGYETARTKPSGNQSGSVSGNLTLAGLAYVGEMRDDGYISGMAVGASYDVKRCVSEQACKRDLLFYEEDAPYSWIHSVSPFLDIRISSKAQVRFSVPIEYIDLSSPIEGTDPAARMHALQIVPSIGVGVASWRL